MTRLFTWIPPLLEGQYAGGLFSMIKGASCGTSRYSTIRSTELKSSSTWAKTLQREISNLADKWEDELTSQAPETLLQKRQIGR